MQRREGYADGREPGPRHRAQGPPDLRAVDGDLRAGQGLLTLQDFLASSTGKRGSQALGSLCWDGAQGFLWRPQARGTGGEILGGKGLAGERLFRANAGCEVGTSCSVIWFQLGSGRLGRASSQVPSGFSGVPSAARRLSTDAVSPQPYRRVGAIFRTSSFLKPRFPDGKAERQRCQVMCERPGGQPCRTRVRAHVF